MTLVGADPGVVRNSAIGQIGSELTEVHDIRDASGVGLNILIRDERVVLALIELIAAGRIERRGAQRVRLHVSLPGFATRFELVNDVGDVDGGVVVVRDAVGRTGGGGNVIGLAGVCDPGVVGGKPICRGSEVDERRIGVADETGIT